MIKKILLSILALAVIFEEWLWDILTAIGQRLSRWLHLQRLDDWLTHASPTQALFAFLVPILIITPFNLLALFLLTQGAIVQGILLEALVKLVGTLLIARVFRLTKPALLTFSPIAWIYHTVSGILQWAHQKIRNTAIYQFSVKIKTAVKATIAEFWSALRHEKSK